MMDCTEHPRKMEPRLLGELAFDLLCRVIRLSRDTATGPNEDDGADAKAAECDHDVPPVHLVGAVDVVAEPETGRDHGDGEEGDHTACSWVAR